MTVTADWLVVAAVLVLAAWATIALCVSAVAAVLDRRARSAPRVGRGAYEVSCPACEAPARRACHRLDGVVMASPHVIRGAVAAGLVEPGEDGRW